MGAKANFTENAGKALPIICNSETDRRQQIAQTFAAGIT
jgi:hypothetical protein